MLPPALSLLLLSVLSLPSLTLSSPSPPYLASDDLLHLIPRNTLFFRQSSTSSSSNLQTFTDALGGFSASPITSSGDAKRPFEVDGDTFTDFATAGQRSCDNQFQGCSQEANEGGNKGGFKVSDCDTQKGKCNDAQKSATVKDFKSVAVATVNIGQDPEFRDFDLICDV